MQIDQLDHLVLTVRSLEESLSFYSRVLGMEAVTFGAGRKALSFGSQKINLHEKGKAVEPKAFNASPGSADLCFLTSAPIPDVVEHITACGVPIIEGPVLRTGATGPILSIYFRDPDFNLIEVATRLVSNVTV